MTEFKDFSQSVNAAFNTLVKADPNALFVVAATGDELYEVYQNAFPEGTNNMFRERREHDCSTCRNFIKNIGGVVHVNDAGKMTTVWDVKAEGEYAVVAKVMSAFVKSKVIAAPFCTSQGAYGNSKTFDKGETWNHFGVKVPSVLNKGSNVAAFIGEKRTQVETFTRSLESVSLEAIEVVEELIDQNSIYMGASFAGTIKAWKKHHKVYSALDEKGRMAYAWTKSSSSTGFRNTVIGTLVVDLSEGRDLESAVASFEAKTAPTNYKRPKALVTDRMIKDAQKKVEELGIEESFHRRYATRADINVNDILFADGNVRDKMIGGIFDNVKATKKNAPKLDKVEQVSIDDFVKKILPKATSVELFVDNKLRNNFMSVIAPVYADAANIFKWDNGFSWSYEGEFTDSIKERVKRAGGSVTGDVRISLSWHNGDDLDLHLRDNRSTTIYFGNKKAMGGELDVDMNAGGASNSKDPVENITFEKLSAMKEGVYTVRVHNFCQRSSENVGFDIEIEVMGDVFSKSFPAIRGRESIDVAKIRKAKDGVVTVEGLGEGANVVGQKWGVATNDWVNVDVIMKSPNAWGDNVVGNEHVFFILKDCRNPEESRGFYNEFLRSDLDQHRKVFEVLGSKFKVPYNDDQLSGVGVSVTRRETIMVRVQGAINRVLSVSF